MTHLPEQTDSHFHWMEVALAVARQALPEDVPVGAVIVQRTDTGVQMLAQACNRREIWHDPTAHAEMLALRGAGRQKGDWRLNDCVLYVTLEPCPMCMTAILQARIPVVVFGADDPVIGAAGSKLAPVDLVPVPPKIEILGGINENACKQLLQAFFEARRRGEADFS